MVDTEKLIKELNELCPQKQLMLIKQIKNNIERLRSTIKITKQFQVDFSVKMGRTANFGFSNVIQKGMDGDKPLIENIVVEMKDDINRNISFFLYLQELLITITRIIETDKLTPNIHIKIKCISCGLTTRNQNYYCGKSNCPKNKTEGTRPTGTPMILF